MKNILFTLVVALFVMLSCNKKDDENPNPEPTNDWPTLRNGLTFTQITNNSASSDYHCRWSNDGTKIAFARYFPGQGTVSLMVYDLSTSSATEVLSGLHGDVGPSWNPDDSKIAIDIRSTSSANSQIYIVDLNDNQLSQFSNTNGNCFRPAWSHDGTQILFSTSGSIYRQLYTGTTATAIPNTPNGTNSVWSSDDSVILHYVAQQGDDIYSVASDGTQRRVLADGDSGTMRENWASFSPDDTRIVYQLYINNHVNVILKNLQSDEMTRITDQNDCRFPDWSPVSNTVVFAYDGNLWLVNF